MHGNWEIDQFEVAPEDGKTRFHDLSIPDRLMHAIADLDFAYCTPIQAELLHATLDGRDAYGRAQTGTGKTAAFLITGMARMLKNPITTKRPPGTPRMLVVAPTRELVLQITAEAKEVAKYTRLSVVSIFGGMDYEKQRRQLSDRVIDIIVATPGRLLDFHRRKDLNLGKTEILTVDAVNHVGIAGHGCGGEKADDRCGKNRVSHRVPPGGSTTLFPGRPLGLSLSFRFQ